MAGVRLLYGSCMAPAWLPYGWSIEEYEIIMLNNFFCAVYLLKEGLKLELIIAVGVVFGIGRVRYTNNIAGSGNCADTSLAQVFLTGASVPFDKACFLM